MPMRIYFSGIGGVAIGPLAMIAQDLGYDVLGSDLQPSPVSEELIGRQVEISYSQDGSFIAEQHSRAPIGLFVYTAALPDDHAELAFVRDNHIAAVKRHELINRIITENNLKLIAVSGTHGKTTTTAMLLWTLLKLGKSVSHSVGTSLSFAPIGRFQPESEYFVYEADEFDRNFLRFNPTLSLVTSIDYDHSDTYPTSDDYRQAFRQFVSQSENSFMWAEDAGGFDHPNLSILSETEFNNVSRPNLVGINTAGQFNRRNASLVYEALKDRLNLAPIDIIESLNVFPGTTRRFELLKTGLYSDYAHHPAEIAATLELAKETTDGKLIVVYQPHQNIRQHKLLESGGYGSCFALADKVYWLPTYLSREDSSLRQVAPEELVASVGQPKEIVISDMDASLRTNIEAHLSAGDTVVAMAAGSLDEWLRRVLSIEY